MIKPIYYLLLLILGICPTIFAQNLVEVVGQIRGGNTPLTSANILLYRIDTDTTLVKFALSNAQGNYTLRFQPTTHTHLISIRSLGFETKDTLFVPTQNFRYDCTLLPKIIALKEVAIKANVPIKVQGDTLSYKVGSFTDGSEKNVEDLLKKLPGLQVDKNGKLKWNGKVVSKVLIEGEDMFSKNYQLITRNLTALAIDEVQAIQNFSENPLLKSVEKSGQTVLNLGLKQELKHVFFGNIEIGVGTENKYEQKTALFSLAKKLKTGVVANFNNTGREIIENAETDLQMDEKTPEDVNTAQPTFNTRYSGPQDFNSQSYTFNRAKLIGSSLNYVIGKRWKAKLLAYGYKDGLSFGEQNASTYLLGAETVSVTDSLRYAYSPSLLNWQMRLSYNDEKTSSFDLTIDNRHTRTDNQFLYNSYNVVLPENIQVSGNRSMSQWNYKITSVRKLNDHNALIYHIGFSSQGQPEYQRFQSDRYALFFQVPTGFHTFYQGVNNSLTNLRASLQWKVSRLSKSEKKEYSSVEIGYRNSQEAFTSHAHLVNNKQEQYLLSPTFQNDIKMGLTTVFIDFKHSFSIKNLQLTLNGGGRFIQQERNSPLQNNGIRYQKLLASPTLSLGMKINKADLLLFYSRFQMLSGGSQLAEGYILKDYRGFDQYSPVFNIQTSDMWLLSYGVIDWSKLYSITGGLSIIKNTSPYLLNLDISNLLSFTNNYPKKDLSINQLNANIQADRLISSVSTKIRWEGTFSVNEVVNQLNNAGLSNSFTTTLSHKLSFIFAPKSILRGDIGGYIQLSKACSADNSIGQSSFFKPYVSLRLSGSKNLSLNMKGEYFLWRREQNNNTSFLSSFSIDFSPKDSNWAYAFAGNNLTNASKLSYSNLSNYLITDTSYNLQPRFFLISAQRRF